LVHTESMNVFLLISTLLLIEALLPSPIQPTARLLQVAIRIYQLIISPILSPRCKFTPTCSQYGLMSLQKYGTLRGSALIIWRLMRCSPLTKGGHDPVF
jgi:hypothetical protein